MKIRVGTFNLFQFVEPPYAWYNKKDKFNTSQWSQKRAWIRDQILRMECDLIGFQEVFSQAALKELVHELGFAYFETVDHAQLSEHDKMKYISTTVALASKYPITHIEPVRGITSCGSEASFAFARLPIKASIILPSTQEMVVYVCHLKSNRLNEFEYLFNQSHTLSEKKAKVTKSLEEHRAKALQQRLCEAIALFEDIQHSQKRPTVLLCDLNDKEFSLTIDALCNPMYHHPQSQEPQVLKDAYYCYEAPLHNPHPEAKIPARKATSYFLGRGNVLDYVFISEEWQVTGYEVLDEHLHQHGINLLLKSDHAQVVCELSFS